MVQGEAAERYGRLVFVVTITEEPEGSDEIVETEIVLPAKHEVCSRCEGHGTHLNPSIGEHAYTSEEFDEAFDDEGRAEYFRRGGIYDVQCAVCSGRRVVVVIDEQGIATDEEKRGLELFRKHETDRLRDEAEDRATMRRECGEW